MAFNFRVHVGLYHGAAGALNFEVIVVEQILPGHRQKGFWRSPAGVKIPKLPGSLDI